MAGNAERYAWLNGEYVEWPEARIHVSTAAVLTGGSVFEGLRGYSDPDERQVYVFRLPEHLTRLRQSMKIMRMTPPYPSEELAAVCAELVVRNGFREDVQIRPTVFFGEGGLFAHTPDRHRGVRPGDPTSLHTRRRAGDRLLRQRLATPRR